MPVNSVNTAFQGVLSNDKSVICLPRQCLMDAVKALILLDFLGGSIEFTPLENQIGIVRIRKAWDDLTSFFLDCVEIFYL